MNAKNGRSPPHERPAFCLGHNLVPLQGVCPHRWQAARWLLAVHQGWTPDRRATVLLLEVRLDAIGRAVGLVRLHGPIAGQV